MKTTVVGIDKSAEINRKENLYSHRQYWVGRRIHNRKNGYVCNTVEEFVSAIKENNLEYREQAYLDLMNHYDTQAQAKRYMEIYNRRLSQ